MIITDSSVHGISLSKPFHYFLRLFVLLLYHYPLFEQKFAAEQVLYQLECFLPSYLFEVLLYFFGSNLLIFSYLIIIVFVAFHQMVFEALFYQEVFNKPRDAFTLNNEEIQDCNIDIFYALLGIHLGGNLVISLSSYIHSRCT